MSILSICWWSRSSVMLALFIHSIIKQSIERKQLIDELESTRATLAVAEREAGSPGRSASDWRSRFTTPSPRDSSAS